MRQRYDARMSSDRPRQRPLRRALLALALLSVIAACTLAGMAGGLLLGADQRQSTSFGTVDTRVRPSLDGYVSVYVPLVDWRVRLLDHRAPVRIDLELRGIDRARAGQGISSAAAANQSLREIRADSERLVTAAIRRATIAALIGGLSGALVAGALITSTRLRRRWLLLGPAIGAVVIAAVVVPSINVLRDLDAGQLHPTAAGGNADELPVVLRFARQLRDVGDEYEAHYATALRSIGNVSNLTRGAANVEPDRFAYVISDFHDNVFVLDALAEFVADSPVFAVGDYVQVGARVTERHAPKIAKLGSEVVAVSGNHDTAEYMTALRDAGASVLDADEPTIEVDGLLVAGYPDPLERAADSDGEHRLRVYGAEYDAQRDAFIEWFRALPERPDVVLVHQHGFAHRLLSELEEAGDDQPLIVLTGHDHEPHVHVEGRHVIIDGGTLGAGGLAAVGEQEASVARIEFADDVPVAVRLFVVDPVTGRAESELVQLP
ncbi:MAG: metallophosphoesterase [Thermoleophilia bacterium]|nr:metallophosphoesterase [Thermoleophilia bacterium]